jgi:protease II
MSVFDHLEFDNHESLHYFNDDQTGLNAGHGGKTGRFRSLEDDALYYAFFMSLEGITE